MPKSDAPGRGASSVLARPWTPPEAACAELVTPPALNPPLRAAWPAPRIQDLVRSSGSTVGPQRAAKPARFILPSTKSNSGVPRSSPRLIAARNSPGFIRGEFGLRIAPSDEFAEQQGAVEQAMQVAHQREAVPDVVVRRPAEPALEDERVDVGASEELLAMLATSASGSLPTRVPSRRATSALRRTGRCAG